MTRHDTLYKRLFSHPAMVRALLTGFTPGKWTEPLDWSTLEKMPAEFVAENRRTRRGDMVWRVRTHQDGQPVYLLLEFQSTVDRRMALRMLTYLGLLCEELSRQTGNQPLPPVLPMVLYNGQTRWLAPLDSGTLFGAYPDSLQPYRPRLRYLLIDQRRVARSRRLPGANLAAAFFQIESGASLEVFAVAVNTLHQGTKIPGMTELRRDLVLWLAAHRPLAEQALMLLESDDSKESKTMLLKRAQADAIRAMIGQMAHDALEEGERAYVEKGVQQGLQQGLQQARFELVERMLAHRFGPLSDTVRDRLAAASAEQLQDWAIALLEAPDIDTVFAHSAH